jgi:hypothetical protein
MNMRPAAGGTLPFVDRPTGAPLKPNEQSPHGAGNSALHRFMGVVLLSTACALLLTAHHHFIAIT